MPENLDTFPQEETPPSEPALKKSFEELALEKILLHNCTTAQLHSTKPKLRFCAGSNPARGVSEIQDGEDP